MMRHCLQGVATAAIVLSTVSGLIAAPYVVVVLDDSGSMSERMRNQGRTTRMDAAKEALISVIGDVPADAQVGVALLNGRVNGDPWVVPLGPVNQAEMRQSISRIRPTGATPLGQFMKVGADALLQLRDTQRYGEYRLLIVTDGEAGDPELVDSYLPDIMARGITVDVIGVDMAEDHSLATQVNSYRRADDPQALRKAISAVFAETQIDGTDAGESDFEWMQGLPDDVAVAALDALTTADNRPVGTRAANQSGNAQSANAMPGGSYRPPVNTSSRRGNSGTSVLSVLLGALCVGLIVVLGGVALIAGLVTRARRR